MRIVKIDSLPPVKEFWIDRDLLMLHACFQILQDCVEKENVDTHMNYKEHKAIVDEIRFLYTWWLKRKNDFDNDDVIKDNKMLIRLIKIRLTLWT